MGMTLCHDCKKLIAASAIESRDHYCPRCGAALHMRIPNSLVKTWSFLITAIILYFPANFLPIMTVEKLGSVTSDTIMSGVISLVQHGMWGIAAVVFIASVLVPLLKMISIALILISIQFQLQMSAKQRTVIYQVVAFVGRWSMLDVFVIALLVALVEFKKIATITAEPGATFFGIVVVLTMIAATTLDPRLIWDNRAES
ncbi:MAG: paraquat-inducible membrane protein A [Methylococcales bacterium]|nr:paraquat-inducible membrane protein A [Methylococcales bacterium]MBT7445773.1 paraquat-inducible membrane protein A [Methylococcales bacterium]